MYLYKCTHSSDTPGLAEELGQIQIQIQIYFTRLQKRYS